MNGPPTRPVDDNPVAGVTERTPGVGVPAFTIRLIPLVVFPTPLVLLVNVTVSEYEPAARAFAPELMDVVTVAVAPAARVSLVADRLTQV